MTNLVLTPADLLARGLDLPPLPTLPGDVPLGTCCAITGQPISVGYPVGDMVTGATAEFLDCFRGGVSGWVSESAARCFKNADPRHGNPTARSILAFEDGVCWMPLIARKSAQEQGRAAWSDLVREVWPARQGQQCLILLTTDTKKRIWIRARVGALGSRTPIMCYDSGSGLNEVRLIDWEALIKCLNLVEEVYTRGFPKVVIADHLVGAWKTVQEVGMSETRRLEANIKSWRLRLEFRVALLIAQKHEEEADGGE